MVIVGEWKPHLQVDVRGLQVHGQRTEVVELRIVWRLRRERRVFPGLSRRCTRRQTWLSMSAAPRQALLLAIHSALIACCRYERRTCSKVKGFPGAPRIASFPSIFKIGSSSSRLVVPHTLAGRGCQSGGISGISNLYLVLEAK